MDRRGSDGRRRRGRDMAGQSGHQNPGLIAAAAQAGSNTAAGGQTLRKLRNELRTIQRRDYFPPPERDRAEAAIQALTEHLVSQAQERAL
jgi:hypothetical protein